MPCILRVPVRLAAFFGPRSIGFPGRAAAPSVRGRLFFEGLRLAREVVRLLCLTSAHLLPWMPVLTFVHERLTIVCFLLIKPRASPVGEKA